MTLPDRKKLDQIARMWNHRGRGLITEMNLKIEKVATDGVLVRMPFNPSFCADEDESLLHGGVLTALLDSVFGLANLVAIDRLSSMATLDLRVDYLRPAPMIAAVNGPAVGGGCDLMMYDVPDQGTPRSPCRILRQTKTVVF